MASGTLLRHRQQQQHHAGMLRFIKPKLILVKIAEHEKGKFSGKKLPLLVLCCCLDQQLN